MVNDDTKQKKGEKLIKFIEIGEFKNILKVEKDKKFKLAFVLAFGSGLRISEIIGYEKADIKPLSPEQIDLQKHQIRIFGGKGKKDRITVTSPWLNETNIKLLPLHIYRGTLQYRFKVLCKRVLGKDLSFHTLRHGFANYMANDKGVPLPMIQGMLGHARLDTTGVYTKANPINAIKKAWESF